MMGNPDVELPGMRTPSQVFRILHHERPEEIVLTGASLDAGACHLVARLDRNLRVLETTLPCSLVPTLSSPRCELAVVGHVPRGAPSEEEGPCWLSAAVCDALAERLWQRGEHWEQDTAVAVLGELRSFVQQEVERVRAENDAHQDFSWGAVLIIGPRGMLLGNGRMSTLAVRKNGETRNAANTSGPFEVIFDASRLDSALLAVGPPVAALPEPILKSHLERDAPFEARMTAMIHTLRAAGVTQGGLIGGFFP
ncbi:MAG: hypothetical protein KF901_30465 [Myxococcales bacterium]|nr:hypothetical protein [Myxococcales bacterium]